MKQFKVNNQILLLFGMMIFMGISSCKKAKEYKPIGDAGQTIVKILHGGDPADPGINKNPIDFVSTPITVVGADIRRDIPNSTELNKTMVVTVKNDDAAVAIANPAYILLPAAWYTIGSSTPFSGGNYTVTFSPGESAKPILITIPDATLLNPSALYGLGFTVTTADANGVISSEKTVVVEIGAKNKYDGVYSVIGGNVQRYTAGVPEAPGGLNGPLAGNQDVIMATISANGVQIPRPGTGGLQWGSGSGSGVAGIDDVQVTVDPATNLATGIALGNATLANWAGHPNYYDPLTKTFYLAWRWNPTGNTREYEIVLKYKGAR